MKQTRIEIIEGHHQDEEGFYSEIAIQVNGRQLYRELRPSGSSFGSPALDGFYRWLLSLEHGEKGLGDVTSDTSKDITLSQLRKGHVFTAVGDPQEFIVVARYPTVVKYRACNGSDRIHVHRIGWPPVPVTLIKKRPVAAGRLNRFFTSKKQYSASLRKKIE